MHILLLRHAPAADSFPDAARALTDRGRALAKIVAAALRAQLPSLGCIAASPLRRAQETASALATSGDGDIPAIETWPALAPGAGQALWQGARRACAGQADAFTLALVGHSPDLDLFVASALATPPPGRLHLDKAGACLIHFAALPAPATGSLVWLRNPA